MAKDIEQQIRNAVERSGLNMFQLSRRTGLRYATIHRFVAGGRGLSLRSAAKLCKLLKLELRAMGARKSAPRRGR